jgi:hypothetical protein
MVNARTIKNALDTFFKENGREPDFNEFKKLVTGQNAKDKTVPEVEEKQESK